MIRAVAAVVVGFLLLAGGLMAYVLTTTDRQPRYEIREQICETTVVTDVGVSFGGQPAVTTTPVRVCVPLPRPVCWDRVLSTYSPQEMCRGSQR